MSEVKDVRAVLEKMRASQPFLEGTPAAEVVAALWSEGLAACATLERVSLDDESGRRWSTLETIWQTRVDVFASILRKAGLL